MNDQLDSPEVETIERIESSAQLQIGRSLAGASSVAAEVRPPRTVQPPVPVRSRTAFDDNDADDPDDSFIGRHGAKLAVTVVVIVGCGITYLVKNSKEAPPRNAPERMVMIQPLPPAPPPPPPPPPPKVEPPKLEEKMIEQAPVEETPEPDPKPSDEPPPLGTGIKGDGPPDGFGLSSKGGSGGLGGNGLGRARGGPFDGFARAASSRVRGAISSHRKTRSATIPGSELRVWVDSTGRVTRAKLSPSSGDPATDAAIQSEVLPGVQLDAPPPGMPMPIVMRLSARRPN
jgi:periplasmic protein TonB